MCLIVALALPSEAGGSDELVAAGRALFTRYCASCHGVDGTGSGPLGDQLKTPPADLTHVRTRTAGRFPFEKLREIIDGRREVLLHGPREMPVWGVQLGKDIEPRSRPIRVSGEITVLLSYLESIQREPSTGDAKESLP